MAHVTQRKNPLKLLDRAIANARTDNAKVFHDDVEASLQRAGFVVKREVEVVASRYNWREGYIDLVATFRGVEFAIELDRYTPRRKSIVKVCTRDAIHVVVCRARGRNTPTVCPPELDHLIIRDGERVEWLASV